MTKAPPSIARSNWNIHAGAIAMVGFAWLGIFWTHPDRDGISGFGDGLLVVLSAAIAIGYAVLSSVAMLLIQRTKHGAWMVHGGTAFVSAGVIGAMFTIR